MSCELNRIICELCASAKQAAPIVAKASLGIRKKALEEMAASLRNEACFILKENAKDLDNAVAKGISDAMLDRLRLTNARIDAMASSVSEIAQQEDPIGKIENIWVRPNGLRVGKQRIPLGVIAMIYEARPNVTSDAAALCLKSGNAIILKGGSEAFHSNLAIANILKCAIQKAGLPQNAIMFIESTDRTAVDFLIKQSKYIDLLIPRGGESLIRHVSENATVPVIQHYKGVCHIFVEQSADIEQTLPILINAKCQRPGVCNAMETLLLDHNLGDAKIQRILTKLAQNNVCLHVCEKLFDKFHALPNIVKATEADWPREYLSLDLAVKSVDNIDEAIKHIEKYSSQHTEAILTSDYLQSQKFLNEVASSTVIVNASTRFADGGELGLGAEIGISTSKLHAYGPMGAHALTTTKFVVFGTGQLRI